MKPQDTGPMYRSKLRECTNFTAWCIKKICKDIGPRPAGSDAELKAEEFIAEKTGKAADSVKTEEYQVAGKAFFAWMKIIPILLILSTVFLIFNIAAVSALLVVVSVACLFGEFLFYKRFLDVFFKKQTSHNTLLTRKPAGEVKRRIIFGGHADSSYEWRYTHLGGAPLMYFVFVYAALGLIWNCVFAVVSIVKGYAASPSLDVAWYSYASIAFVPSYCLLFFFINYNISVDGANDNLTGCLISASVLKFLDDNDVRFENTEVDVLLTGGEEAGLRGAKAYCEAHKDELKSPETVFICIDTAKDYDDILVYNRDMSGLTHHDKKVCALLKKACENAGVDAKYSVIFAGASDAAAMTQAGIPSATLAAMNPGPPKYYHTRDDKADILNLKTIEKCIEIAVETAFMYDEKGLEI